MSKYENFGVTINKSNPQGVNTNGMQGVVESWDSDVRKYKVAFEGGWCGWYKRSELIFDDPSK